jgi:hypothetical protein
MCRRTIATIIPAHLCKPHGSGEDLALRVRSSIAVLIAILLAHGVLAQDKPPELTPAGKAILQSKLAYDRPGSRNPLTFPLAMCTFPGGLCGAVRRDGSVAVPPQYDWVGKFSDHRAAVRLSGLYGFVDEDGREIVKPQYRVVDDYRFGFAQVDVDGKSGLIDRDGKMVIEPKYGFIRAIAPDRFEVSEVRHLSGRTGGEDFSGMFDYATGIVDLSGDWIGPRRTPSFDKDDPSINWVRKDKLWGLARADGSWLVEPKFDHVDSLSDGLARVWQNGKVGFIDRTGVLVIAPVYDRAWSFSRGLGRTSAIQDGTAGAIDKTGAWVFRTGYQEIHLATDFARDRSSVVFGWHFKKADRWGLLDLDGRVVLDADFDQSLQRCHDGRLIAYKNKEWLYFRADGSPLQPPDGRLTDATCGRQPPYTLKIGNKYGLVDAESHPLTPLQFDAVTTCGSGVRNVKIDGKWGRIGPDGHWLLEPKFDYLSGCLDVFVASIDGKRGFMRSDGSWLIEPKFEAAQRRDADTAFATVSGATGVLRLKDESWAVTPRPGILCDIHFDGAIMSESNGKRAILSPSGETWIDVGAERVGTNLDFGLLTFLRDGKWGLVDTAGQVIVEPQFDEPVYFTSGLRGVAWAKRDGNWCAIDRRGRSVSSIPCAATNPSGPDSRFVCKVEP